MSLVASAASAQLVGTRDNPSPTAGRSSIRGRVVTADGRPVRRAEIRISAAELRVTRRTLTDADGRYQFGELPPGRYSITATKPTFVAWSFGQTRTGSAGTPVALADNHSADNIDITMPRGSVIAGRIVDDFGEPVINARVTLMRQQFRGGGRTLVAAGNFATTNDIGEYRFYGLTPSAYFVSVPPQGPVIINGPAAPAALEGPESRNGYAATFFPGTTAPASAQKITVGLAQTVGDINIVLVAARTATLSGQAVGAQGRPMGGFLQIMTRGIDGMAGLGLSGGPIRPDGTFSVPNVPPGDYLLRVNAPGPQIRPGLTFPEFSLAFVSVNGEDVAGIQVLPVIPVSVTGHVSFFDQAVETPKPATVKVTTLAATIGDINSGVGNGGDRLPVKEDFTFDLKTAPGQMAVRAYAPGWQIRTIRVGGIDVTDAALTVGTQGLNGVEIEMTNQVQEISGAVTDANGRAIRDCAVLMFAQDRSQWAAAFNQYVTWTRSDTDGRFKITSLPAGDYYAIAVSDVEAGEGQDPEYLEGLARFANTVSLTSGEKRSLDLKFFPGQ